MEGLTKNFKLINTFLVVIVFVCEILSSEVPRPRGVSLSRAPLYPADKDFTCFDGSKTIPFSQVNDDYCDCPDASDEPGTAACPHGSFHCTNAGHKPRNIASSRVNDGICDCCDGTDEYAEEKTCPNNCIELGRSAREEAQRRAELVKAGKELRAELSQKGIQMKQEKQTKLFELQKNREEAEKVRAEKEALKKEAEALENAALEYYRKLEEEAKKKRAEEEAERNRAEAAENFKLLDSNQDGLVEIAEIQSRQSFDKDRNGEVSEEEAKFFLNDQVSVDLDTFVANCWSNVKSYLTIDAAADTQPTDAEEPHSEAEDMHEGQPEEEQPEEEQPEEELLAHEEEEEEEEPESDHEPLEPDHREDSTDMQYDEETQKLVERATAARNEFNEVDKNFINIGVEIKEIQDYLAKDFGPEEEFATLQGQCFEYHDHEYIYKLCPFDKTVQQPKSSSSETRLGTWGHWGDSEVYRYDTMVYDRGQQCWNGPTRSTTVRIECGSENKVTGVSEPNRCEYMFDFETPAACREILSDTQEDIHDEL